MDKSGVQIRRVMLAMMVQAATDGQVTDYLKALVADGIHAGNGAFPLTPGPRGPETGIEEAWVGLFTGLAMDPD